MIITNFLISYFMKWNFLKERFKSLIIKVIIKIASFIDIFRLLISSHEVFLP